MKKLAYLLLFTILSFNIFSQEYIDIVETKDGSILRGVVFENEINKQIKIELSGGEIFVILYDNILSMNREKIDEKLVVQEIKVENTTQIDKKKDIRGYSLVELNNIFSGLNSKGLYELEVNEDILNNTDISLRKEVYEANTIKGSVGGYVAANFFVPGLGSILQGDVGTGVGTIIVNILASAVLYGSYSSYISKSLANGGEVIDSDNSGEIVVMGISGGVMLVWNIMQTFFPISYKKYYNNTLEYKLNVE